MLVSVAEVEDQTDVVVVVVVAAVVVVAVVVAVVAAVEVVVAGQLVMPVLDGSMQMVVVMGLAEAAMLSEVLAGSRIGCDYLIETARAAWQSLVAVGAVAAAVLAGPGAQLGPVP